MAEDIIKVDSKIQPLNLNLRKSPELVRGERYFVCYGQNIAEPCTLIDIKGDRVVIQSGSGEISVVYKDEIGKTPEEAVVNTVSNFVLA